MKRYLITLLPSAAAVLALAGIASAQTADEVVEKHLAALGGRAAVGRLTSRKLTGTVTLTTPNGDIYGSVEAYAKAPNKSRTFMQLDLSAFGAGTVAIDQRFDGATGFVMNPMQGNTEITGNQLENLRNSLFPHTLLNYKERGVKLDVLPSQKVGDRDTIVLALTPKAGSVVTMFIDAQTYLLVKAVTKVDMPTAGGLVEQTTELSDYREVDGVKVAFQIRNSTFQPGNSTPLQSVSIKAAKIEHNIPMEDSMFVRPPGGL